MINVIGFLPRWKQVCTAFHIKDIDRKDLLLRGEKDRMLRHIRVAFHFLDKDMMKKIMTTMIRPKLEYAETLCCTPRKEACDEIRKNRKNSN